MSDLALLQCVDILHLHYSQQAESVQVQCLSAVLIKLILICLSAAEIKAAQGQHNIIKPKQQSIPDYQAVYVAPHEPVGLRMECASAVLWLHLWGEVSCLKADGDCTFIFQSNNQTTSPFSGALRRWGGPAAALPDAVTDASQTHLYYTDMPLLCDEGSPILFA